jgi:hypothetical protein
MAAARRRDWARGRFLHELQGVGGDELHVDPRWTGREDGGRRDLELLDLGPGQDAVQGQLRDLLVSRRRAAVQDPPDQG